MPTLENITGPWTLAEYHRRRGKNGLRVISTFSGGGGSSMGWALAGFESLAGVEIDPQMAEIYEANLKTPVFVESVRAFSERASLAKFEGIDVVDGSPPCSSFSTNGLRQRVWGQKRKFNEGQAEQILDSLFLDWIALVNRLQPKVALAENVTGMIKGNARGFAVEVRDKLQACGYDVQLLRLCASRMGVPQRRTRVFFFARRKDLDLSPIELLFDEPEISAREALRGTNSEGAKQLTKADRRLWERVRPGDSLGKAHATGARFSLVRSKANRSFNTFQAASGGWPSHWAEPRFLSQSEMIRVQSFPEDFDFGPKQAGYVCGMSVPPLMMQRVAGAIRDQWFAGGHDRST